MTTKEKTKQGEIPKRYVIAEEFARFFLPSVKWEDASTTVRALCRDQAYEALKYLHSQGVVIRVDRELPVTPCKRDGYAVFWRCYQLAQKEMREAGYVATVRLIKENPQALVQRGLSEAAEGKFSEIDLDTL